jgi:hypothetical protein
VDWYEEKEDSERGKGRKGEGREERREGKRSLWVSVHGFLVWGIGDLVGVFFVCFYFGFFCIADLLSLIL